MAAKYKRREYHGLTGTSIYRIWVHMVRRCTDRNDDRFGSYGGRGISVCDRWLNSAAAFAADMGQRPAGTSLDRIDNNGNYEPGNCRWATPSEQQRNRRVNRLVTLDGETLCVKEWSERIGIDGSALSLRLDKGWDVRRALTEPKNPRSRTMFYSRAHCRECGSNFRTHPRGQGLSYERCVEHCHKRKEKPVAETKQCSFCVKPTPATHKCQCSDAKCQVYACASHRHLTQNPALIPTGGK